MKIRIIFNLVALLYVVICQTHQLKAAQRDLELSTPDNTSLPQDSRADEILQKVMKVPFRSHDTFFEDLSDMHVICFIFCFVISISLCTLGYHWIRIFDVLSRLNAEYNLVPKQYLQAIRGILDNPNEDFFVLVDGNADLSATDFEIVLRMHLEAIENFRW